MRTPILIAVTLLSFCGSAFSQTSSSALAVTPPMGWNSWNYFGHNINAKVIRDAADQIVASGMREAGYIYINIDDTWEGERDANGVLHSNSKFPDMKALTDYVHSKGLKIGIYSSPGPQTCAHFAGSYGHEEQDAKLFASWGIDYLKYDLCGLRPIMQQQAPNDKAAQMRIMIAAYIKMGKALKASGRPIVYSLCEYGWDAVWEWAPSVGANLWRTGGDINPTWVSIYSIINSQAGLASYSGPGHWNDPDMLEVGNGKLTLAENRTLFSMWAMLAAPLLAGNDLVNMTPEINAILTNRDVIAIDQDRLGQQATRVYSDGEVDVWIRHLSGGALAIAVLNAGAERTMNHPFYLSLSKLGLHGPQQARDVWSGQKIELTDHKPVAMASHDTLLLKINSPK